MTVYDITAVLTAAAAVLGALAAVLQGGRTRAQLAGLTASHNALTSRLTASGHLPKEEGQTSAPCAVRAEDAAQQSPGQRSTRRRPGPPLPI